MKCFGGFRWLQKHGLATCFVGDANVTRVRRATGVRAEASRAVLGRLRLRGHRETVGATNRDEQNHPRPVNRSSRWNCNRHCGSLASLAAGLLAVLPVWLALFHERAQALL